MRKQYNGWTKIFYEEDIMSKRAAYFLLAFWLMFAVGLSYAQETEETATPTEITSPVPPGWTDVGPYYYGIAQGGSLVIHFRSLEVLKDKLTRIPFVSRRNPEKPRNHWQMFSASYIEQAVRDILKINGIADYAASISELAFLKTQDHFWEGCEDITVNPWVRKNQDKMCNLEAKVMIIIEKAFCKDECAEEEEKPETSTDLAPTPEKSQ